MRQGLTNAAFVPDLLRRSGEETVGAMVEPSACEVEPGWRRVYAHYPFPTGFTDGVMFASRTCWNLTESILPSSGEAIPRPLATTQPRSLMDPPPPPQNYVSTFTKFRTLCSFHTSKNHISLAGMDVVVRLRVSFFFSF